MASTVHTSATIRGITYNQGAPFVCAYAGKGNGGSEGNGTTAAALTVGKTYYFLGYVTADDSGTTIVYPYRIGSSSSTSSAIGYYKAEVFPYATYTIKYNANGGTGAPSSQTKTHGTNLVLSSTKPTRTGYTFKAWALSQADANNGTWYYQAGSTCGKNENLTLYAVWEANSYTYNIAYKSSSGVQLGTGSVTNNYGTTNTISPKSFTGYTSPSSQSVKWDSTSAKTITFTYAPISYSITINCNGGSGVSNKTYTIETATFTLGTPTRTGHTFNGWTGSNGNTAQQTVSISKGSTGNKSYTAQWRTNVLTIKYHINGGVVNSDKYYVSNNLISLTSSSSVLEDKWSYNSGHTDGLYNAKTFGLSREGYKFVGWKVGSSGSIIFDQDDASVVPTDLASNLTTGDRTVTLYAVWEISGVVYIDNGNKFEPYLVYIDNGTSWDLYLPYVDNGTDWNIIS